LNNWRASGLSHDTFAGRPDRRFERIPGRRAETLDALTYALALREGLAIISTCAKKP
jgi:hypothetical protein